MVVRETVAVCVEGKEFCREIYERTGLDVTRDVIYNTLFDDKWYPEGIAEVDRDYLVWYLDWEAENDETEVKIIKAALDIINENTAKVSLVKNCSPENKTFLIFTE